MNWIASIGKILGGLLASDDDGAKDNRRHREKVISQGLARIAGQSADKEALQSVLKRQEDIDALLRRMKEEGDDFDTNTIQFDGLSKLTPFQESKKGYILVYAQGFLTGLLQRLILKPKPIVSVVFRPQEDPSAHVPVLERGHGLAFELPFFPDEDPAMLCEFFGEITAVSQKASAFATLTQSAVLPVWCRMDDEGMTLEIAPPLEDHASAEDLTLALVAHFEKRIRATPAEMDWDAECWDPPLESLLPSRSPWKLALRPNQTLADLKPYRILARVPDSVREACLCIPAIRALKRGREDVHLTVLTTAAMAPMWQQLAECDACLALEAAASEGKTFSLGIVFDRDDKQALSQIQRHSVARVIGMENHPSAEKFDDMLSMPRKLGPPEHRNRTNLRLAHRLGADVVHDADLRSPVIANTTASQSLTVGVAPDSDDGPTYAWPTERYLEVVLRMSKANPSITWRILIHEQTDPSAWETLRSELGSDILTIVLGASSIEEQLVALRGCALLLSNDNDFLHLAAAMYGMPSIAIYGPSEPIESAPTSSLSLTLRRHVECTPCFLKECPLDHRCLNEIDVDEATAALETSLARLTA